MNKPEFIQNQINKIIHIIDATYPDPCNPNEYIRLIDRYLDLQNQLKSETNDAKHNSH